MSAYITVKLFASYRELAGVGETTLPFPANGTLIDLLEAVFQHFPMLVGHRDTMLLAVNREFAEPGDRLQAGDEVALLPPVSGGGELCRLQKEPIDPARMVALVRDVRAGAVILFLGSVRKDPGVRALEYEAYAEMAVKQMEMIRSSAKEMFGVNEMAMVHRTGRLPLGEISVVIACSAPHRQEAFRACEWAMEELKRVVPIWKTEREDEPSATHGRVPFAWRGCRRRAQGRG